MMSNFSTPLFDTWLSFLPSTLPTYFLLCPTLLPHLFFNLPKPTSSLLPWRYRLVFLLSTWRYRLLFSKRTTLFSPFFEFKNFISFHVTISFSLFPFTIPTSFFLVVPTCISFLIFWKYWLVCSVLSQFIISRLFSSGELHRFQYRVMKWDGICSADLAIFSTAQ